MTDRSLSRVDLAVAGLAAGAAIAGSYALGGWTPEFTVAAVDQIVINATPGSVSSVFIERLGSDAHYLHVLLSFALTFGMYAAAARAGLVAADESGVPAAAPAVGGGVVWAVSALLTNPVDSLLPGAAAAVVLTTAEATAMAGTDDVSTARRRVVRTAAVAGVVALSGTAAGQLLKERVSPDDLQERSEVQTRLDEADAMSLDVEGMPGLVSYGDEFYTVDIAAANPAVPAEEWSMAVTGEVENEFELTYEDVQAMGTEHRFVTLRCVGDSLNGDKMDTALWTGTPLRQVIERAAPTSDCECVMLRGADGYYNEFPLSALETGFLAWGMNGKELPQKHGHPVRALIPGHWGEINLKWLTEIEFLEREAKGYWEKKGWHGTGPVNTVAKLWAENDLDDGRVELAGHAYAGTRGVERVEVSVDGGDSWETAELGARLPGEDVWRQWRFAFEPTGTHEVLVRAVDGEGTVQPKEREQAYPSGASGWVGTTVRA